MDAVRVKQFISKFSSKKDALTCLDVILDSALVEDWRELRMAIEKFEDKYMAQEVMDMLNETFGTHYQNLSKIEAIIRLKPKVTLTEFESIIRHKHETWGQDPTMKKYLRPATLFGSKNKFETYLEDAIHYWMEKVKNGR